MIEQALPVLVLMRSFLKVAFASFRRRSPNISCAAGV